MSDIVRFIPDNDLAHVDLGSDIVFSAGEITTNYTGDMYELTIEVRKCSDNSLVASLFDDTSIAFTADTPRSLSDIVGAAAKWTSDETGDFYLSVYATGRLAGDQFEFTYGFYCVDLPDLGNVRDTDTLNEAAGTLPSDCILQSNTEGDGAGNYDDSNLSDGNIRPVAYGLAATGDLSNLDATEAAYLALEAARNISAGPANIRETATETIAGVATGGSIPQTDILESSAGTYHEATEAEVEDGVMFGAASALEGTLVAEQHTDDEVLASAAVPGNYDDSNLADNNVRNGVTYGLTGVGNVVEGGYTADKVLASAGGNYVDANLIPANVMAMVDFGVGEVGTLEPGGGGTIVYAPRRGRRIHVRITKRKRRR